MLVTAVHNKLNCAHPSKCLREMLGLYEEAAQMALDKNQDRATREEWMERAERHWKPLFWQLMDTK